MSSSSSSSSGRVRLRVIAAVVVVVVVVAVVVMVVVVVAVGVLVRVAASASTIHPEAGRRGMMRMTRLDNGMLPTAVMRVKVKAKSSSSRLGIVQSRNQPPHLLHRNWTTAVGILSLAVLAAQ